MIEKSKNWPLYEKLKKLKTEKTEITNPSFTPCFWVFYGGIKNLSPFVAGSLASLSNSFNFLSFQFFQFSGEGGSFSSFSIFKSVFRFQKPPSPMAKRFSLQNRKRTAWQH